MQMQMQTFLFQTNFILTDLGIFKSRTSGQGSVDIFWNNMFNIIEEHDNFPKSQFRMFLPRALQLLFDAMDYLMLLICLICIALQLSQFSVCLFF